MLLLKRTYQNKSKLKYDTRVCQTQPVRFIFFGYDYLLEKF